MSHPQNSYRGAFAKERIEAGNGVITGNSTGNLFFSAGIALSGEETDVITQNSTALLLAGGLALSGEETDIITQNSTSVNFAGGIKVSGKANAVVTGLSTGIVVTAVKIGAKWLTANSTGLLIDGVLIDTTS
jgi:hypothetical protein